MRRQRRIPALIALGFAIVAVLAIIVAAVAYGARSWFPNGDTYTVEITTFPTETRLILNGDDPVQHEGTQTYEVDDDELHIIIDRDEFAGHEETYRLTTDETVEIVVELVPQTDDAEALLREQTDYYPSQADITEDSLQRAERLQDENAILRALPQESETFRAYEGISDSEEFGIHVYVYPETEDEGREAFAEWMNDGGFSPDDYDIIYHLDEDGPPLEGDTPPSADELADASPPDVGSLQDSEPDSDDPNVIVQEFLAIANTHDSAEDNSPSTALLRAEAYMTSERADSLYEPQNPIVSPRWREAAEYSSISDPWIYAIDAQTSDDTTTYQARVCWAWITETGDEALIDTPRAWTVNVVETEDGPRISDFTYQDAYIGDDPDTSICAAHL